MHSPVLVTAPEALPVTLDEAKLHLRVDGDEEDTLIAGLLNAAVSHLDGPNGVLGRALAQQTWRQDFDAFDCKLRLAIAPVASIVNVTWRDDEGQIATVAADNYTLKADQLGSYVRFPSNFSFPSSLYEDAAVSVTYTAGYPQSNDEPPASTVPAAIKAAILLLVGHWYAHREAVSEGSYEELPLSVRSLVAPYRVFA